VNNYTLKKTDKLWTIITLPD